MSITDQNEELVGSARRVVVISSDCHAGIPRDEYKEYLERRYHTQLDDYASTAEVFGVTALEAFVDHVIDERTEVANRCRFTDSAGRLLDLEENGVVSEVLFPAATPGTTPPWSDFLSVGAFRARNPRSRELKRAGERAYNRWLAEFCQDAPADRRLGLAFVPLEDVESAVSEIEWAASVGLRGILMPIMNYDLPEYCQEAYWDPIWAACSETGLSLNFHGGYGVPDVGDHQNIHGIESNWWAGRPFSHLVFSCVFDRHPNLRLAITEAMASWVPNALRTWDVAWDGAVQGSKARAVLLSDPHLPERSPSEYWQENGFVGASITVLDELQRRHEIGIDSMMYGIDYPHPEGNWADPSGGSKPRSDERGRPKARPARSSVRTQRVCMASISPTSNQWPIGVVPRSTMS